MTGGFDLGFERAGLVCKWQVEKDPFCQKVLAKHWPDVERFEDVKEVGKHNLEPVDVICGGFPCQPHSLAGKRQASEDDRDLWSEFARIIGEVNPRWVVAENVPGILTSEAGRYFGRILFDLAQIGYDAEWHSIPASWVGAKHRRRRVFIVAHAASLGQFSLEAEIEKRAEGYQEKPKGWGSGRRTQGNSGRIFWAPHSEFLRVDNGVPSELDRNRVKSLGNAVVPQVAEFIATLILRAYNNGLRQPAIVTTQAL